MTWGATVKLISRRKMNLLPYFDPMILLDEAEIWVRQRELLLKKMFNAEERAKLVRKRREVLFYRISEIHARAEISKRSHPTRLGNLFTSKCRTLARS